MNNTVNTRHPAAIEKLNIWRQIRDCIAGSSAVKRAGRRYLPEPGLSQRSDEASQRYRDYLDRAVFYNVTGHTLSGLVGLVFAKAPVADVPEALLPILDNASGCGASLEQLARRLLGDVIAYGRAGILVDYPCLESPITRAEAAASRVQPTIATYGPESILNWKTTTGGGKSRLTMVVLAEKVIDDDGGFEIKTRDQWRVLKLVDGVYTVDIWREVRSGVPALVETTTPRDHRGLPFDEIPFLMIGSIDNDPNPDPPLLADLAVLNLAHYRNSADYEESCFIVGQPTAYAAGLTQQWMETHWKDGVSLGARAFLPLPEGGKAGLIQASPNTLAFEAMAHKERQMVAIGARLIENRQIQRTATEAALQTQVETSALACCAQNVSRALTAALRFCCRFVGVEHPDLSYDLSVDYNSTTLSPDDLAALVASWQAGAISFDEMRFSLKAAGIAYEEAIDQSASINL